MLMIGSGVGGGGRGAVRWTGMGTVAYAGMRRRREGKVFGHCSKRRG